MTALLETFLGIMSLTAPLTDTSQNSVPNTEHLPTKNSPNTKFLLALLNFPIQKTSNLKELDV